MNLFPRRRFFLSRLRAVHPGPGFCWVLILLFPSFLSSAALQIGMTTIVGPQGATTEVARTDIRGIVVDSVTGQPIPRALVSLNGRERYAMLTESDGGFVFEKVPADNSFLQARRPGYFEKPQIFVQPETATNVVIKMTPAGLIFGQVVDENGEPVESAQVRIMQQRVVMGKRRWTSGAGTQTNDQGRFRIPNLRPGSYIVGVSSGTNSSVEGENKGYPSIFFPKAPDVASATAIKLSAGAQVVADFELTPVHVFRVSGIVIGMKPGGTSVFLAGRSGNEFSFPAAVSQSSGEFEIRDVPRGTYTLRAQNYQQHEEPYTARTKVIVNANVTGVAVVLHPPIAIPVDVSSDISQPAGTGTVNPVRYVNVQAIPESDDQQGGFARWDGSPENGRLMLHLPESGTYNLVFNSPGTGYVRSATSGSTDLLSEPLVVPDTGEVNPIQVVLASDGARLKGMVRRVSGPALVIAVPDNENRQPVVSGYTPQGQFFFGELAPGDYSLYALKSADPMDYSDRDLLKPFRSKAVHVTLAPSQETEVTLDAIEVPE